MSNAINYTASTPVAIMKIAQHLSAGMGHANESKSRKGRQIIIPSLKGISKAAQVTERT